MRHLPILAALAVLVTSAPALAGTIDVPTDHATVAAALAAAVPGDSVLVAPGTFAPSTNSEVFPLTVPDGVSLLGSGIQSSILDAEGTGRVVQLFGSGAARVSGFTLRGGVADRGGGIHITDGTHSIDSLMVTDCGAQIRGSAINVQGSAAPSVHHNIFWECYDTDLEDQGDPHVAQWSGTASGEFLNNLVGRGDSNGLFILESAFPVVRHNIFFDNGIDGVRGRGICFFGGATTVIAHNLFWENSISALVMDDPNGDPVNVTASTANAMYTDDFIYGNLDADPELNDPDAFDFSLQPTSAAIDAGEPGYGTDPDGTLVDLGPIYHPSAIVAAPTAPRRVALGPASPNPFNPATVLELRMAAPGFATVTVHDARGRRLRTLFSGHLPEGTHPVRFDGTDDRGASLASGVYFALLRSGGETDRTALVLVR
jgi:hypothetical protein